MLRDASRSVMSAFQQRIEKHQLTLSQYFILRELWQDDGLSQREISERVNMLGPAMTVVLDTMEARGFVVRVRSSEDRRRINIFLTAKGRDLRPMSLRYSAEMHDAVLAGRSQSDVEFVRDFCVPFASTPTPFARANSRPEPGGTMFLNRSIAVLVFVAMTLGANSPGYAQRELFARGRAPGGHSLDRRRLGVYRSRAGLFQKHNLKVELVPMNSGSAIAEAVAGGSLDAGFSDVISIANARSRACRSNILRPASSTRRRSRRAA